MAEKYRVCVIGSTGRGNYGHGLDQVWLNLPNTGIVAVADDNEQGLAAAVKRLGNPNGYDDYRKMLESEKPDIVSVCPRWLDQHRDMTVAAAESGTKGIYQEKPLCRTLREADEMVSACEKNNVKVAVSHQTRYSPILQQVRELLEDGKIGRILEFRIMGKEDHRGGGEDLWVLGTHVFDLTHHLGGYPEWCHGFARQEGREVTKKEVKPGNEGIGPLAGDHVCAMYGMPNEVTAYFKSIRNARGNPNRFGLMIYGSEGIVTMNTGYLPAASWLPDGSWTPARSGKRWIPISSQGPGKPEVLKDGGLHAGNLLACQDLIAAIEEDRDPESSIQEAIVPTEMIVALFESHRQGRPVSFPLKNRDNPLAMLN